MTGVLFEDIFDVKDIDPDGKKFDRGKTRFPFTSGYCFHPNWFRVSACICVCVIGASLLSPLS